MMMGIVRCARRYALGNVPKTLNIADRYRKKTTPEGFVPYQLPIKRNRFVTKSYSSKEKETHGGPVRDDFTVPPGKDGASAAATEASTKHGRSNPAAYLRFRRKAEIGQKKYRPANPPSSLASGPGEFACYRGQRWRLTDALSQRPAG